MILFCRKLISKGASFEVCDKKGNTVKQILESHKAFPSIPFCNPPRRPLISQLHDSLLLGLDAEIVKALLRGEESKLVKRVVNSYIGSETVLYHVVDKGNLQCVEILLNAGADAGTKMLSGQSCLNVALFRGEPEILELLIDNMKKNQSKLDLREQSFGLLESLLENYKKISRDRESDNFKCLKRILADDIILNVNAVTKGRVQQSILHVAASYNNQEALMLLLEKGSFLGSTKIVDGEDQGNIFGALRPETLVQAMDGCISHLPSGNDSEGAENILSSHYSLNLNYEFLVPYSVTDTKENNEVKTLVKISQNEHHKKSIEHPLIQAFIYAKWCKVYGLYITNLLLYLAFVNFLTLFMYGMKDLRILEERASKLSSANETIQMEIEKTSTYVSIWMWLLIPVTLYMLVREVFQILYTFRVYLKNIENYLEILLIVLVIIFCSAKLSIDATRHLAAWSMIIAWLEFILLLGRAPPLAIYITMFRHVSWNFLKLIFLYGALLFAFTVSFNIILQPVLKTDVIIGRVLGPCF
ncbi:UNVERIFIED_CONTAM: hypothetical protein GTU68_019463 [Idotea baltica]|nr:hypothetical protein [Idotea baltica]